MDPHLYDVAMGDAGCAATEGSLGHAFMIKRPGRCCKQAVLRGGSVHSPLLGAQAKAATLRSPGGTEHPC